MRLEKALISLRVCAGWSEPLLVAHTTLLEISCHGSIIYMLALLTDVLMTDVSIKEHSEDSRHAAPTGAV